MPPKLHFIPQEALEDTALYVLFYFIFELFCLNTSISVILKTILLKVRLVFLLYTSLIVIINKQTPLARDANSIRNLCLFIHIYWTWYQLTAPKRWFRKFYFYLLKKRTEKKNDFLLTILKVLVQITWLCNTVAFSSYWKHNDIVFPSVRMSQY